MLALGGAVFAGAASMRCLNALLPVVAGEFGRSVGSAGSAISAYALSYSVCQFFHGPLGDRLGVYRVVTAAACLSTLMAGACAIASSLPMLVTLRAFAGAVAGAVGPLALAWVSQTSSLQERPIAFARLTAAAILGAAAGQTGGGLIGGWAGWRWVFVATSALFATSALALLLTARTSDGAQADATRTASAALPRSPLRLLREAEVRSVLIAVGIEGFSIYLSLAYVAGLFRERFPAGPAQSGALLLLYGLGGVTFVAVSRRLIGSSQPARRALLAGMLLTIGFLALGVARSTIIAGGALFAIGFGFLMLHNLLQLSAARMAPDSLGTSLSMFAAASSASQAIGAGLGGYIFDRAGGELATQLSAALLASLAIKLASRERRPSA